MKRSNCIKNIIEYGVTEGYIRPKIIKGKDFVHKPKYKKSNSDEKNLSSTIATLRDVMSGNVNAQISLNKVSQKLQKPLSERYYGKVPGQKLEQIEEEIDFPIQTPSANINVQFPDIKSEKYSAIEKPLYSQNDTSSNFIDIKIDDEVSTDRVQKKVKLSTLSDKIVNPNLSVNFNKNSKNNSNNTSFNISGEIPGTEKVKIKSPIILTDSMNSLKQSKNSQFTSSNNSLSMSKSYEKRGPKTLFDLFSEDAYGRVSKIQLPKSSVVFDKNNSVIFSKNYKTKNKNDKKGDTKKELLKSKNVNLKRSNCIRDIIEYGATIGYVRPNIKKGKDFVHKVKKP